MGIRTGLAQAVSVASTVALKNVFHRPAANFPGKIALYVDPAIIGNMAHKLKRGSVIVAGTNGKTTTTNLLADALERAGQRVVCNRTGANLDSGVATSLLHAHESDWGIFESDEMWMVKILPFLQSDYVLLLNLFRDQLDRVGEIDRVQDSIVNALSQSPRTVLIYNADDPLCTAIADRCPNRTVGFGMGENMHLAQNTVSDAQMCQRCSGMLEYGYRQYGQLGTFHCSDCDFHRHTPEFEAVNVKLGPSGLSFTVRSGKAEGTVTAPYSGAYMVYNLLATYVTAVMVGTMPQDVQAAIDAFKPDNGRLQNLRVHGRDVLLNLAKNPTGFNQNMKLVVQGEGRKAAAFFINDKEADGHDISWIWDVDFEELAASKDLVVFAGGIRKNDLQMRLKYAGIDAKIVDSVNEVVDAALKLPSEWNVYAIANYTSLPAGCGGCGCAAGGLLAVLHCELYGIAAGEKRSPASFGRWRGHAGTGSGARADGVAPGGGHGGGGAVHVRRRRDGRPSAAHRAPVSGAHEPVRRRRQRARAAPPLRMARHPRGSGAGPSRADHGSFAGGHRVPGRRAGSRTAPCLAGAAGDA